MPDSTANRKDIRRREKQAAIDLASRLAIVRNLMSTTEGRAWFWHKLSACHLFTTTFALGQSDATAFNEGQRAIGLSLLAEVMLACPDQYIQAQREHNERAAVDERRSSTIDDWGDTGSGDSADRDQADGDETDGPIPEHWGPDGKANYYS